MKITNTSRAIQGVHTTDGLKFIDAGATRDLDVAPDYVDRVIALPFFTVAADPLDHDVDGKKGGAAPAAEFDPELIDAMTDEELRAFITQRDGKAPHPATGHDKLVSKAKGEA